MPLHRPGRALACDGVTGNDGKSRLHDFNSAAVGGAEPGNGHRLFKDARAQVFPAADAFVAVNALTEIADQRKGVGTEQLPQHAHLQRRNILRLVHHDLTHIHPIQPVQSLRQNQKGGQVFRLRLLLLQRGTGSRQHGLVGGVLFRHPFPESAVDGQKLHGAPKPVEFLEKCLLPVFQFLNALIPRVVV